MCVSSWKIKRWGSAEGRRRRRMCRGTHKWANLKFKRASGQGCGPTLHWCSVAVNKRRGRSRWAYVGKHSSTTTALFFTREKLVCRWKEGKETRKQCNGPFFRSSSLSLSVQASISPFSSSIDGFFWLGLIFSLTFEGNKFILCQPLMEWAQVYLLKLFT